MCLAIPARVIRAEGGRAVVEIDGISREVNVELLSDVSAGDYLIIHAGYAIERLDAQAAGETLALLEQAVGRQWAGRDL